MIAAAFVLSGNAVVAAVGTKKNDAAAKSVKFDVAFTPQAPFSNWRDPRQQDGCEETVSLMAVWWARGKMTLSKKEAEKQIIAAANYQEKKFGNYHDTNATATQERIIKGYFGFDGAEVKLNARLNDIKNALTSGSLVIIPADGRRLKNPYFTQPGPAEHNLLIIGYDQDKKEFIINDPGTRRGAGYRYSEKIIDLAWRDYPTGRKLPIKKIEKNLIIIHPQITAKK